MIRLFVLGGIAFLLWRWLAPQFRGMTDVGRARKLLGVSANADRAEILAAHRRLIVRVHPDAGGSEGLTVEVNAARDLLLRILETKRS